MKAIPNQARLALILTLTPVAILLAEVRYRVRPAWVPGPQEYGEGWPTDISATGQVVGDIYFYAAEEYAPFLTSEDGSEGAVLTDFTSYVYAYTSAINGDGHFLGDTTEAFVGSGAFLARPETGVEFLDGLPPGGRFYEVNDLNDHDQVVGSYVIGGGVRAFVRDASGQVTNLGDLPGGAEYAAAYAIDNDGNIVGVSGSAEVPNGEAFLWTPSGGMVRLGDIPGGGIADNAHSIGGNFVITGTANMPGQFRQPYVWSRDAGFRLMGYIPSTNGPAFPYAGNARGQTVGWARSVTSVQTAFVGDADHGVRDLNGLLDPCTSGVDLWFASAINDNGWIGAAHRSGGSAVTLIPYLPGDLNEDSLVGLDDLATQLAHFGADGGVTFADGDCDCDADVDLQDLAVLLGNFDAQLP